MENTIYFYSGTGNSLWTARKLAHACANTELIPIPLTVQGEIRTDARRVGIIFPVHIWGLPEPVIRFIQRIAADPLKYYFALAVNAGQVAAALLQLRELMQQRGLLLHSGFSINLPTNYIPWAGAIAAEKQQKLFDNTQIKINLISQIILAEKKQPPERGLFLLNIILSALYRLSFSKVPQMDKSFFADDKCSGCKICEKICPANNITVTDAKPLWQHHCEQCFACLQWCPEEAIQYGKNTAAKKRYHHPEVKLSDMLACVPQERGANCLRPTPLRKSYS
jgi:ferredoxin